MYPVDLHVHTAASTHAYNILNGYIARAKRKDIKLFAITDHGPDMKDAPHHWHFISMRIWPRAIGEVGIPRSIGASIKNVDGEINHSGRMFNSLDLITAGFHEPVFAPHSKVANIQVMIATIASGGAHIISHLGNPRYEIGVKAAAEAVARHQLALGVNNPSFLHSCKGSEDNCCMAAAAVRDAGGQVALGSDSHTVSTMGEFEECLKILDMVNFPLERTSDASPRRLLNFLESRDTASIAEFADL